MEKIIKYLIKADNIDNYDLNKKKIYNAKIQYYSNQIGGVNGPNTPNILYSIPDKYTRDLIVDYIFNAYADHNTGLQKFMKDIYKGNTANINNIDDIVTNINKICPQALTVSAPKLPKSQQPPQPKCTILELTNLIKLINYLPYLQYLINIKKYPLLNSITSVYKALITKLSTHKIAVITEITINSTLPNYAIVSWLLSTIDFKKNSDFFTVNQDILQKLYNKIKQLNNPQEQQSSQKFTPNILKTELQIYLTKLY